MSEQYEVPPSIRELEEQLAQMVAQLEETIEQTQQQSFDSAPPISREELRAVSRNAHSQDAPPELREMQRRIERGEFTWDDVLAGDMMNDPGVRAGLEAAANFDDLREVKDRVEAGEDVEDVIAGGPRSEREDGDGSDGRRPGGDG